MYQRKEKVVNHNGVKYKIPEVRTRPTIKALKKRGFVSIMSLESMYKWVEAFVDKYAKNPQIQKPTEDPIDSVI